MIFQKKDMDTWDRAEIFCHFIDELRDEHDGGTGRHGICKCA